MSTIIPSAVGPTLAADPDLIAVARTAIADRVDRCRKAFGAVAVIVERRGSRLVIHGRRAEDDARAPDEHTSFELGCLLYTFDAVLLCDMVERGEVALTDRVDAWLPSDVKLPQRGQAMTLLHLATHTSGLPGRRTAPVAIDPFGMPAELYLILSTLTPTRPVGTQFEESRLGAALLRHVLARRLERDYEEALRTRVFLPLEMSSTVFAPRPEMMSQLAVGHNDRLEVVAIDPSEIRSTAHDLSLFLQACLRLRPTPLEGALARMGSVRTPSGPKSEAMLGWQAEMHGRDEVISQDGHSRGCRAWMGYRPRATRGVAILSNAATTGGLLDIGYHLLDASYPMFPATSPLLRPPRTPCPVTVPIDGLQRHVGQYQLTPHIVIRVTREGEQLFAEKTGRGRVAMVPESPVDFFCREVEFFELPADTRLTFRRDEAGATVGLVLSQRGQETWLPRVERAVPGVWFGESPTSVDATILEACVGHYRFEATVGGYRVGPDHLTITREADRLLAAWDATLTIPLVARSPTEFFVENDVVHVQFKFEADAAGRVIGVVASYDGMTRRGSRTDRETCDL